MTDKKAKAADFLNMFGGQETKVTAKTEAKKKSLPAMAIEKVEMNEKSKKERFTFSLSPEVREQLTTVRKYYNKKSDSAFIEELIEQLYDALPE